MEIKDTFLFAVNAGLVQGHRLLHKKGRNESASTSTEDVMAGGNILTPLTAAVAMEAISSNVNDTVAGNNARVINIKGVDLQHNPISAKINMNGTTVTSSTTKLFLRVTEACVSEVGTFNTSNLGDITIRVTGGGANQMVIPAGVGEDRSSHYTVPKGETAVLVNTRIDIDSSKTASVQLKERGGRNIGGSAPFDPHRHSDEWDAITGNLDDAFIAGHRYPEMTDLWAESIAGQNNTAIGFDYDLLIIKNWVFNA